MLFISRKNLDALKSALVIATIDLRDSKGQKVMIRMDNDAAEATALHALGIGVSMDLGRSDSVHASDVQEFSGLNTPIFTPPKL